MTTKSEAKSQSQRVQKMAWLISMLTSQMENVMGATDEELAETFELARAFRLADDAIDAGTDTYLRRVLGDFWDAIDDETRPGSAAGGNGSCPSSVGAAVAEYLAVVTSDVGNVMAWNMPREI
jgi:hypothetical protein